MIRYKTVFAKTGYNSEKDRDSAVAYSIAFLLKMEDKPPEFSPNQLHFHHYRIVRGGFDSWVLYMVPGDIEGVGHDVSRFLSHIHTIQISKPLDMDTPTHEIARIAMNNHGYYAPHCDANFYLLPWRQENAGPDVVVYDMVVTPLPIS